ncbi:Htur_1727 family rSAM-partnered candidate RiPP [Haloarchaeobius sp. HRN-SO-5]|uniref:Htur_1727 family rSAM-partnered candidate RiPP n=1 Tax=Haloarchaeobius sp. HRN-SO-5 TaxID=3446118 RepID=UPI003EBEE8EC
MTERRARVSDGPRSATGREWEVFVRPDRDGALRHVGSVTAGDADAAHEHAARLFDPAVSDIWLCPAGEVVRYAGETLDDQRVPAPATTVETGDASTDGGPTDRQ